MPRMRSIVVLMAGSSFSVGIRKHSRGPVPWTVPDSPFCSVICEPSLFAVG